MSQSIFPTLPGLGWSVTKTPIWKTIIHESSSGYEYRAAMTAYPRYQIGLTYEFLRGGSSTEIRQLIGFFLQMRGAWDDFLWTDPEDSSVTAQGFGAGDGVTKSFQLVRAYGGFVEPILDLNGTPSIYVGGVLQSSGFTISATGVVTFASAPSSGAALTWTGAYYRRVRFLRDEIEFDQFVKDIWSAKKVELITVKK